MIAASVSMRPLNQSGLRLAALGLVACALLQVFCPAGLLAMEARLQTAAPRSGCHGSAPKAPISPPQQQKCCAASSGLQASPSARYVVPAPLVTARRQDADIPQSASVTLVSAPEVLFSSPPGLQVLRI